MKTIRKSLMIMLISLGGCGLFDQEIEPKNHEEIEISLTDEMSTKPDQTGPTKGE